MNDRTTTILIVGVAAVGAVWWFSGKSLGGSAGKNVGDAVSEFTKSIYKGIGKPILKQTEKTAVTVYKKGLKPVGKAIWDKGIKPVTQVPKKVFKPVGKGATKVFRGMKKAFHL